MPRRDPRFRLTHRPARWPRGRIWSSAGWRVAVVVAVALSAIGCGGTGALRQAVKSRPASTTWPLGGLTAGERVTTVASVPFAPVSAVVKTDCQLTADAVGYAVPCPTVLPAGMMPTSPEKGCRFAVIAPSDSSLCRAPRARGWFFGSSEVAGAGGGRPGFQHLIVFGAPRVVRSPARAVDGPIVYPERVLPRGRVSVGGRMMRWFDVPMGNPSAFRGHLVLLWSASGHTFVYGFHVTAGMAMARALDYEFVTHLRMVSPTTSG